MTPCKTKKKRTQSTEPLVADMVRLGSRVRARPGSRSVGGEALAAALGDLVEEREEDAEEDGVEAEQHEHVAHGEPARRH